MISLGELANLFDTRSLDVERRLAAGLSVLGAHVVGLARSYIGQERPDWPALAPSTIAQKTRLGYTGKISATDPLLRTGDMRASIKASVHGLHLTVGSHSKIALYQEMGTSRIPPRPFLAKAMMDAVHATGAREWGGINWDLGTTGRGYTAAAGSTVINVSTAALDQAFRKNKDFYIATPKSEVLSYARSGAPMSLAEVGVSHGTLGFNNGRNRFAAARAMGARTIPISVEIADLGAVLAALRGSDNIFGHIAVSMLVP